MNDIDGVTVKALLEFIKSKEKGEGKVNHIYHQIQWWYGEYVKEMIIREHRRTE